MDGHGWVHRPIVLRGKSGRPLLVGCAENIRSGWCLCFPFVNLGLFMAGHFILGKWVVAAFLISIFIGPIVRIFILPRA